ncbi:ImmA/IrrE family metallo-endopeptidase [Bacillus sp. CLL-7-23]|uniref:ImmA/IrrE family metallo-endopeptidase n=1 Tax=Bacillus changyiensis TaxID=3004103 RepID=A0ABT4X627_9BACI|nr:ImmA/IrrE family metallo-endopeptidase [Bacillus changyiensis]MDA1477310.1 ImmA/IrrE family metallo-endopeptidase [Bacillus changyiensis]MDA7027746.1 ImmA/IrrE family metallo-endopeptidase [Bacillus changyiensis]
MIYTNSHLEDWIENLYKKINISRPEQLNIERIASALDILIVYNSNTSFALRFYGMYTISLDCRKNRKEQWIDFSHEVCHDLRHINDEKIMPLSWHQYLENQAKYFSYHFCIPTFMLNKIKIPQLKSEAIKLIGDTFNVTYPFASCRLEMYQRKQFEYAFFKKINNQRCTPVTK